MNKELDHERIMKASKAIVDGRDLNADFSGIMMTLEATVAVVLLAVHKQDPYVAARMLNEGLLTGVESRLSWYLSQTTKKA
jgi:hypothetical protein